MQQNLRFLLLVVCAGLVLFGLLKGWNQPKQRKKTDVHAVHEEKPFVIIIPSYNNGAFVEKNLRSVFSQNYKNYRVIYIDDHSADDTFLKAKNLTTDMQQTNRTTLIRNEQNQGALANLYNAIHSCHDYEIVVLVDGDDFLAHEQVLSILNQNYQDPEVWMSYGNFLDYPTYQQNPVRCKELSDWVIRNNSFRKHEWVTTHLRTFYASLFKRIHLEDMVHRGRFFPMGWDLAFMLPMLEMSGTHVQFIKETLYLYNRNNPISDHRVNFQFQQECANSVRTKQPYERLQELVINPSNASKKADIVIFSSGKPMQLYALLESFEKYVQGVGKISVICPRSRHLETLYEEVEKDFPKAHFVFTNEFKPVFLKLLQDSSLESSPYILLAQDNLVVKDFIHLEDSIDTLDKTKAYGLYFSFGTHIQLAEDLSSYQELPPLLPLKAFSSKEPIMGWQMASGNGEWKKAHPFDLVLYSKEELKKDFSNLEFKDLASLEAAWEKKRTADRLGLFYAQSKCIKNHLTDEILSQFEQGLKIDIKPFFQIENKAKRNDQEITLIHR
ncbi:MAG TPA: glycosyltransferase family A protein [Rhabdochlamydiaceae bacterium]|nr:glycosyltransferase family A protein [Rhabdochlamydiaceae bacterium]